MYSSRFHLAQTVFAFAPRIYSPFLKGSGLSGAKDEGFECIYTCIYTCIYIHLLTLNACIPHFVND